MSHYIFVILSCVYSIFYLFYILIEHINIFILLCFIYIFFGLEFLSALSNSLEEKESIKTHI